nr:hypothetical protein [Tanacetum cinerariifolium]
SSNRAISPRAAKPQKINAANAELIADNAVTAAAETRKRSLSLRKPKKVEEQIPGMLIKVRRRVENVGDSADTFRAYSERYVCGITYPAF